jgi:HSP20 family protein
MKMGTMVRSDQPDVKPLARFRQSLSQTIRRFFSDPWEIEDDFLGRAADFLPRINIEEQTDRYVVEAELPGMEAKEIEITVCDGVLTIRGEKRRKTGRPDARLYRVESRYGAFRRALALPVDADLERINVENENGMFYITVPKNPNTSRLHIHVRDKCGK